MTWLQSTGVFDIPRVLRFSVWEREKKKKKKETFPAWK